MKHKRLFYNTIASFANQFVTLVCTFILPRQILLYYGSDVNGLISSITQFLGFIALMEMGVGAVVQSVLYKPLVDKDHVQVSKIVKSSQQFFNKLGSVLMLYVIALCFLYPYFSHATFSVSFIVSLIIALSINFFAQYYFGLTRQLLLDSDQRAYVPLCLNALALILNTGVGILLIWNHFTIQTVQFAMALILLIRPVGIWWFVRKHYTIYRNIELTEEPIKQKWNGLAQHISAFLLSHTDVVLLTFFSTLSNVSIYSVYYMVVAGIRRFITTLMTGAFSWFGQLYAANDPSLQTKFAFYEWLLHTLGTLIFTVAGLLIVPFAIIYTQGIHDANYVQPFFGGILLAAYAMYTIRLPYLTMILAAGHYKETQHISILEAVLNLVISIVGVQLWGLCGVALGTLVAMTYCTTAIAYYLQENIIHRSFWHLIKHYVIDILSALLIIAVSRWFKIPVNNYFSWTIMATKITLIALVAEIFINGLFYPNEMKFFVAKLKNMLKWRR